jgi:hypothetical protein
LIPRTAIILIRHDKFKSGSNTSDKGQPKKIPNIFAHGYKYSKFFLPKIKNMTQQRTSFKKCG